MRVALTKSLNSLPILFALEKGIFRDYSLDLKITFYSSFPEIEKKLQSRAEDCGEVSLVSYLKQSLSPEFLPYFYPLAPLSYTECKFYSVNPVLINTNFQFCKKFDYFTFVPLQESIQNYIFEKFSQQLFSEDICVSKNIVSLNLAKEFFYFQECLGVVGDPLIYPFLENVKNIFQIYEDTWLPSTVLAFSSEYIKNSHEKIRLFLCALQDSIFLLRSAAKEDIFHNILNSFVRFSSNFSINELRASIDYANKALENIFPLSLEMEKENIFLELISYNSFQFSRFQESLNRIRKNVQAVKSFLPIQIEQENNLPIKASKIRYQKIDAEMYKILFREAIEMMMMVSEDFAVLDVNNKFISETGLEYENIIDKHLINLFPKGNDFELLKNNLSNNDQNVHLSSLTILCKNDLTLNVDVYVHSFKRHEHKDFLFTLINNSEKKEILRLKNEFISNISHELRTPMTNIQGYFEMLLQEPQLKQSSEARANLDAIDRNIKKMKKLIDNLLQLGKAKAENQPQLIEIFEPHFIIEEVIYLNEALAKEKKLEIRKSLNAGMLIQGNKFEFSQVITNLIVNAIKYTDDGYVFVSCRKNEEGFCEIKVKDTGIGIDSKYHSAIFERFFRVPDFQNRKVGGTGIGLAIAREIIEKMGGKIKLESELGKGSEFKIFLPLVH